jgi:Spy/CpxP family protein refolding chaperone
MRDAGGGVLPGSGTTRLAGEEILFPPVTGEGAGATIWLRVGTFVTAGVNSAARWFLGKEIAMKTWSIGAYALAGLLAVGSGVGAYAAPGLGGEDGPHWLRTFMGGQLGRMMTLRAELGVTGEQRTEIRKIVESHRSEIAAVAKPIVEKRRALREAALAANSDEAAIRAAANDFGKAIGDAAVLAAKVKPEVFKVLTPEQRKKVTEFRAESDSAVDRFMHEMGAAQ